MRSPARSTTTARAAGASDADQAALEWALRAAEAWGAEVLAVTAGPPAAEAVLRHALAAGAARAVRVDVATRRHQRRRRRRPGPSWWPAAR